MTTTFSFPRLLQLIRKQWIENARLYLYSVLALVGLLGLIMVFWVISDGRNYTEDALYIIFVLGLFISGAVFASMSFAPLSNKERGTYWLSFPASHLEKLITMIFYNVIVFTVIYCACFFLVKSLAIAYVNGLVAEYPDKYTLRRSVWGKDQSFLDILPYFLYGFVAVQSLYLLGSVYFSRYSFVVTTIVGSVLIFLFSWYSAELVQNFLHDPGYSFNVDHIRKYTDNYNAYQEYKLSPVVGKSLEYFSKFIWAPVFWVAAWYRLKEKQI